MKLQDFLIGIGVFALFTVIIFGFIDTSGTDCQGIYCEKNLNVTHDSATKKAISNISTVGQTTESDFQSIKSDMREFEQNRTANEEPTESNILAEGVKVLISLPNSWKPIARVMTLMQEQFQIPPQFTQWVIGSIIIIIILILLASILKNPLKS